MPKISTLDQKLWPTGREQTHTQTDRQTDRQTEKANTEDPFFRKKYFFDFRFSFKGAVRKIEKSGPQCLLSPSVCLSVCLCVRGL